MECSGDPVHVGVTVCQVSALSIREAAPNGKSLLVSSVLCPCHRMTLAQGLHHKTQAMFEDAICSPIASSLQQMGFLFLNKMPAFVGACGPLCSEALGCPAADAGSLGLIP